MTKFSGITPNSTPALADYLIGVTAGNVDDRVTLANLAALISLNLTLPFVESVLASNFSTSSTTPVDVGLKVTLPTAGTWLVIADIRSLSAAAGQFGIGQLYNITAGAVIANTQRLLSYAVGSNERQYATINKKVVTTAANTVVGVYMYAGGAYTSTVESDPNGQSTIMAVRIGS